VLVVASRNAKKCREIAAQLAPHGIELIGAADLPAAPDVEETGTTFAANAALKATVVALAVERWTLADDSGLEVDALDGAPGVYSARYAGVDSSDARNNQKLLEALRGVPPEQRGAQFVCHLVVADPQGQVRLHVEGRCRGRIVEDCLGGEGFGYDPLFLIPEYGRTFGQLSPAVKSCLSHRARAFAQLIPRLKAELDGRS
jgi:XTP/dITP diphosphohydrolase